MHSQKPFPALLLLLLLYLAANLSGCAGMDTRQREGLSLPPAGLPEYAPGEYYIYDGRKMMTAVSVQGETIAWQINGSSVEAPLDFTRPWGKWQDDQQTYSTTLPPNVETLWPLSPGKHITYSGSQTITAPTGAMRQVERKWTCTVRDPARVEVPAGAFDTHVIDCQRYSDGDGGWRGSDTYYYAPALGHYVMVERRSSSQAGEISRLTEYGYNTNLLSPVEQGQLRETLRTLLDKGAPGAVALWKSGVEKVGALLAIIPGKASDNDKCRWYRSSYSVTGKLRSHERQMCRLPEGGWQWRNP